MTDDNNPLIFVFPTILLFVGLYLLTNYPWIFPIITLIIMPIWFTWKQEK